MLYLQIGDDGVLHVLLLFLQEVEAHSIQCVRTQFIVPEENLRDEQNSFVRSFVRSACIHSFCMGYTVSGSSLA